MFKMSDFSRDVQRRAAEVIRGRQDEIYKDARWRSRHRNMGAAGKCWRYHELARLAVSELTEAAAEELLGW